MSGRVPRTGEDAPATGRRKETMAKCAYLKKDHTELCMVGLRVYAPSGFELDEYCRQDRHRMCPFYCKAATDGMFPLCNDLVRQEERRAGRRTRLVTNG
jgi:hypothetical protein